MKKGFTLVELLAVLAILSVVIVIAGTSYSTVNRKNKIKHCKNLKLQIENTAIEYVSEQNYFHSFNELETTCIAEGGYSYEIYKCCKNYKNANDIIKEAKKNPKNNGDIIYKEVRKKYTETRFSYQCTPIETIGIAVVNIQNILDYGYFELNEDNKLENPYTGKVIDNLTVEVRMDEENNFVSSSNLDCGD